MLFNSESMESTGQICLVRQGFSQVLTLLFVVALAVRKSLSREFFI